MGSVRVTRATAGSATRKTPLWSFHRKLHRESVAKSKPGNGARDRKLGAGASQGTAPVTMEEDEVHQKLEFDADAIGEGPATFILNRDGALHVHIGGGELTLSPDQVKQLRRLLEKERSQIAEDSELVRLAKEHALLFATSTYGIRFDNQETGGSLRIRHGIDEGRARTALSEWIKADCPMLSNASDDGQPWSIEHLQEE
jgi:hypothetical protein